MIRFSVVPRTLIKSTVNTAVLQRNTMFLPQGVIRPLSTTDGARMLTAYQAFVKDRLPQLKSTNSSLKASELMKMAGSEWREMDTVAKSAFENKYEAPPKKEKKARKSKSVSETTPKKPRAPTAYAKFVKANFQKHSTPGREAKEVMKVLGAEWKTLNDSEKAYYASM